MQEQEHLQYVERKSCISTMIKHQFGSTGLSTQAQEWSKGLYV